MVISTESAQKVLCCNQAGLLHMCFDMNTCTFCLQPPRKNEAYNQGSYKWGFPTIRDPQVSMAPNQLRPSGLCSALLGPGSSTTSWSTAWSKMMQPCSMPETWWKLGWVRRDHEIMARFYHHILDITHLYLFSYIYTLLCIYIYVRYTCYIYVYVYIYTYIYTHLHTSYISTYIRTYMHACMHTYIHTYLYIYIYIHIYTYIHTYIYIHIYIHIYIN